MHWLAKLGAVAVALSPVAVRAQMVAPHDKSFTDGDCKNCHTLFDSTSLGGSDFSGGCMGCHAGLTTSTLAFPRAELEATPGVKGTHHSWSGHATNPQVGAVKPSNSPMAGRLVDGQRLQCSVCHDLHVDASERAPQALHTVPPLGAATAPGAGSGTEQLTITAAGTISRGYRIQLVTPTSYIVSKAFGVSPIAWLNWDNGTSQWVPGSATGTGRGFTAGTPHLLNPAEPLGMSISISAAGVAGDSWDVLVSYPGLRVGTRWDLMCTSCHKPMAMGTNRVAGRDPAYAVNGTRVFSHPTGEALGSNGLASDRAEILDANGLTQGTGDGNTTNDLVLKEGVVNCTTCHAIHGADSNSLTTDVR